MKSKDFDSNIEVKKLSLLSSTNLSFNSRYIGQLGQTTVWPNKKNSRMSQSRYKSNNTSFTGVNTITVNKDNKVKKNLSQLECYSCHKKDYYAKKYVN